MRPWDVIVSAPAERGLRKLPEKYAHAVVHLFGSLAENPQRVGKPLRFDLEGRWVARRGPYRVVYEIDEDERRVKVSKVAHRADIYRPD